MNRELTSLCLSFVVAADLGDNIITVTRIIGFQKAGGTGDREAEARAKFFNSLTMSEWKQEILTVKGLLEMSNRSRYF